MITLAPLAVSIIIWVGLWLYLIKLDRKNNELEKNSKKIYSIYRCNRDSYICWNRFLVVKNHGHALCRFQSRPLDADKCPGVG